MPGDFAAFTREPLRITVAGTQLWVPYRPAGAWAAALNQIHILAALLATQEQREVLGDLVLSHPQAVDDLKRESRRILGDASGRKWWEAARLLGASSGTEVLGRLVLAGVDPWNRSLGEWCAATYALCVKGQDDKGRLKFDFSLSIPPAAFEDEWDDDGDDPDAIMASLAGLTGNG